MNLETKKIENGDILVKSFDNREDLKKELNKVVDWSKVDKEDYLLAMERSPVKDTEIRLLLQNALTDKVNDRLMFMKGIDTSYQYEGYYTYKLEDLGQNS